MKTTFPSALLALLLAAPAWAQEAAPSLALKIEHSITTLSADGITRDVRYAERMVRQGDQVWLARVLPPHAHEAEEHAAGGKAHKHMDVAAAARWVQRGDDGALRVRLVNAHDQLVVDVPQPDWGNVGFDGQWAAARHLLDPAQIQRMKPLERTAPAGARWYQGGTAAMKVLVLWDAKGQFPLRVESSNTQGTSRSVTVATREPLPATLPWSQLAGFKQKEYSDLLD